MTTTSKPCKKCGAVKPLSEYHCSPRSSDGRVWRCNSCRSEEEARRYAEDRVRISERKRRHYQENRERVIEQVRLYNLANPHVRIKANNKVRTMKYGMHPDQYEEMLVSQGGLCAICGCPESQLGTGGKVKRLSIDHCHEAGFVRGLLCANCNIALGYFRDDVGRMRAAIDYLEKSRELGDLDAADNA